MNRLVLYILKTELGRRIELQILINLVASSLGLPKESLLLKRSGKALELFSQYTSQHLPKCSKAQLELMYKKAYRIGTFLRWLLTDRSVEELMRVVIQLYRNIGIEMEGLFPKEVSVVCCHFSRHYDSLICQVASNIDSGVICGLYGADVLCFTQRITEGKDKCCCHLSTKV